MSQLKCVRVKDDPFDDWVCFNRLEMFYNKFLEEGFKNIDDFSGMNENSLIKLWNKIDNNKIGIKNRSFKSIKKISLKPVVDFVKFKKNNF